MVVQYKSRPSFYLPLIKVGLAAILTALVGCASATAPGTVSSGVVETATQDVTTPDATLTPVPIATSTLEQSSTPTLTAPGMQPPAPTLVIRPSPTPGAPDFMSLLPTVSPGLGTLANHLLFFSDRSGNYQLYQIALDGSSLVQLTQDPVFDVYDMEPAWSTDGKIAFTSKHVNGSWEVFVLYPDGGLPIQLTNFNADSWSLAWSPDDRSLAFVSNVTGDDEIYLITLDGGAPVNLTRNPVGNDFLPVWSPDGQRIAFVSDREGREAALQELEQDIFVMMRDGSQVTRLTEAEGRDTSPSWSPDGRQIAFVSERDGNFEVYLMKADGSESVRLTQSAGYEWSPTWSPDGQLIAFTSTRGGEETYDLYVMAPDGSNQTRLTVDPANDIIPRWWP